MKLKLVCFDWHPRATIHSRSNAVTKRLEIKLRLNDIFSRKGNVEKMRNVLYFNVGETRTKLLLWVKTI